MYARNSESRQTLRSYLVQTYLFELAHSDATKHKEKKKSPKLSPILDQIINGSPSTTLNVLNITSNMQEGTPFFKHPALNRFILFKYPNFTVEISDSYTNHFNSADASLANGRPVETAIYIPINELDPEIGGYAIYLRQKDAEALLQRYVGVSSSGDGDSINADFKKLLLIDEIPSLDPFLLKTAFDRDGIEIDKAYLNLDDSEERKIKHVIGDRVRPIVARALGGGGSAGKSQRFVEAIWDPTLPEASLFIEAFKIQGSEALNVFSAWKGISFYQQQFTQNRAEIAGILKWMKSEDGIPHDIRWNKSYEEQLNMYKQSIQRKMMNILSNINQVFKDYDNCHQKFVEEGDPTPFRNFLVTSHYRYWVLGY